LLDAAARILDREGWDALTTRAIAAEAGAAIGTVYDYFANRDAVLQALFARYQGRLDARVRSALEQADTLEEAVDGAVDALAASWFDEPGYRTAWLGVRSTDLLEQTSAGWTAHFLDAIATYLARFVPQDVDPDELRSIARAAVHLVSGMLLAAATLPPAERHSLIAETHLAARAYLAARLG